MYELSVKGHFASAHFLRGYEGPCEELHGHTWQVELTITGSELNDIGLGIDFKEIKKRFRSFLLHLDHVNLNEVGFFKDVNPTTENLARYVFEGMEKELGDVLGGAPVFRLKSVRVWESDEASATYRI